MRRWMPVAAAVAAAAVVAAGVLLVAPRAPAPDPQLRSRPALGPWYQWARSVHDVERAVDALPDTRLRELDSALAARADGFTTGSVMALASRLFAGATAAQVDRLHELVPSLEPAQRGGEWARYDGAAGGPFTIGDVHQGSADDCWLLAGLGAMAVADPGVLEAGILANDNGTYTVGDVTVSPYLPVEGDALVYAHAESRRDANWTSFYEKAHAAQPRFGSWAALAGGAMVPDSPVTAAAALADLSGLPSATQPARTVTLEQLRTAVEAGRPTTATTFLASLAPAAGPDEPGIVDRHVYVLTAVDGDEVVLHNPWGYTTTAGPEEVRLGIEEFQRRILLVTFGKGAAAP